MGSTGGSIRQSPTQRGSRAWSRVVGLLMVVALVLPSSGVFGAPLQEPWSLLGLLLAVALVLVGPSVPAPTTDQVSGRSGRIVRVLVLVAIALPLVATLGKAVLLSVPSPGFAACYRILTEPTIPDCERSFDALKERLVTRYDATIDFGPARPVYGEWLPPGWATSTWALGAVNEGRYNFYNPGDPSRERMPFIVNWSGTADAMGEVTIQYVGQGELAVNGQPTALPASYAEPATVTVPIPSTSDPGPVTLSLFYVWTPTVDDPNLPFAEVRLSSQGQVLAAQADASWSTPATVVVDAALLLSLLLALAWLIWQVGRSPVAWTVIAASAGVCVALGTLGLPPPWYPVLVVCVLLAGLVLRWSLPRPRTNALLGLVLPFLAVVFMRADTGEWGARLLLRLGGSDFLTYEALARTILAEGSLRAGEDAFYYSPAVRYLVAAQHGIFGDTDTYALAVGFASLVAAAWFAVDRLLSVGTGAKSWSPRARSILQGTTMLRRCGTLTAVLAGVILLGSLVGTSQVLTAWGAPYSEFWTWVCLMVALPLAVTSRRAGGFILASILLGVMFTFRANQAVGIAAILALAAVRIWTSSAATDRIRAGLRVLGLVALPFLAVALLPALHNAIYANRLLILTDTVPIPLNYPLPVGDLLRLGSDPAVRETLLSQLSALAGFIQGTPVTVEGPFLVILHMIQVAYAVALVMVIWHRRTWPRHTELLLGIPLAFALPHVFVQVWMYYPRHVVAIYLSACLVLVAIAGRVIAAQPPIGRVNAKQARS